MDKHQKVIQEWLDRSEQDYKVACDLFASKPNVYAESIAFHLQQSVEKLFKAVLVQYRQQVPKVHDLEALANTVNGLLPSQSIELEGLETLTVLGIASRYPGISVSLEDLQNAFILCASVRQVLLPCFSELPVSQNEKETP